MLMKKGTTLLMALGLMLATTVSAKADIVDNYTVDFNTPIETGSHNFKVADGWRHIVEDNNGNYVTYSYNSTGGVDGTGCLQVYKQAVAEDNWSSPVLLYDLLVTPKVTGTVTIKVKQYASNGYIEFYKINDDFTRGDIINKKYNSYSSSPVQLDQSEFKTITLTFDEPTIIGLHASEVYMDDFTAQQADVIPVKSMAIASAKSHCSVGTDGKETTGSIYWRQDPDHGMKVKVCYLVSVTNTSNVKLSQGDENYSVSLVHTKNGVTTAYGTTPVPQNLEPGETSEPFEVTAYITPSDVWSSASAWETIDVRENLEGTITKRVQSQYKPYEHVLVFRDAGSYSTSKFSSPVAINFGVVSEEVTRNFEIFNNGAAPLTINEISIEEPFTVTTGENMTIDSTGTLSIDVTFPATATGTHSGNLTATYIDNDGTEKTVTLATLQGSMVNANTWYTTFGDGRSSTVAWPEGSVAEGSVTSSYSYSNGSYNVYAQCTSSNSSSCKFFTPLLHANAGDTMSFIAKGYSSNGVVNVYVTTDRYQLGEPVQTVTTSSTSTWTPVTITFEEAGDYYVAFELKSACIDDIVGLTKADVNFDIYFTSVSNSTDYQSGQELSREVTFIPVLAAKADDYTVQLILQDTATSEITAYDVPSKALTANSKSTTNLRTNITPVVTSTVVYDVCWKFTFTDGTVFTSPSSQLTIICEPQFCFVTKGTADNKWNAPTSAKSYTFGKVNEANLTAEYEIFNWGQGALTVNSVTMPDGFTTTFTAPVTLGAKERGDFPITFSATELGAYSGNIVINFVNAKGENEDFEFAVSGTMLDQSKYYCSFDNGTTSGQFPAGSVRDSNVNISNTGNYSAPNCAIYSSSATNNLFITPLLHAEAGESINVDAKVYQKSWSEGYVKVYASATRQGLRSDDSRTLIASLSKSDDTEEASKLTPDFKTYSATIAEAGDYYIGFEINNAYLDDLCGLSLVEVAHDIEIAGFTAPETAMQNNVASATVQLRNFGLSAEEAGSYSAIVSVNGVETEVTDLPEIAAMSKSNETPASINVPFRYSKVGTFPVSVKFAFGDYILETEPANVEFTEEVLSADKTVGEYKELTTVPFNFNYKKSETIALYTPDKLGLNAGDVINSIAIKGYNKTEWSTNVRIGYAWVDDQTISPSGDFDESGLTMVINQDAYTWAVQGSTTDLVDMITFDMSGAGAYVEGKSLLLFFHSDYTGYKYTGSFESSTTSGTGCCYFRQSDNTLGSWGTKNLPVLHIALDVEAKTMSGVVTNPDDAPVEGATVTLTATDGSGVEYSGTTAADGSYSINVIQASRTYNVLAKSGNLEAKAKNVTFGESVTMNFKLGAPVVDIDPEVTEIEDAENANVHFNLNLTSGYHALALPFAIDENMVATLFGTGSAIYTLAGTTLTDGVLVTFFETATSLEPGEPFLVHVTETIDAVVEGVTIVAESKIGGEASSHVIFSASYKPTSGEGKFTFSDDDFIILPNEEENPARYARTYAQAADVVPAFHATLQARPNQQIDNMSFAVDQTPTNIKEITVKFPEGKAYNLRGMRTLNPAKGLYIINGKKVLVK